MSVGAHTLMEWGITNGNDRYLYGEKMKAYLISGARHLPILKDYPNPEIGANGIIVSGQPLYAPKCTWVAQGGVFAERT